MKKLKKFIKNNLKPIMTFVIGFLLSGGVVYATAAGYLYDAQEVKFDPTDTNLSSTDVQGALEELNDKAKALKVGDYFTYTPDRTSNYYLDSSVTGYYGSSGTIFYNKITLWRVIGPWDDSTNGGQGLIGVAANGYEYNAVTLQGVTGYKNANTALNTAANTVYSAAGIAKGFFPGGYSLINTDSVAQYMYNCGSGQGKYDYGSGAYGVLDKTYTYSDYYAVCESHKGIPYITMVNELRDWYNPNNTSYSAYKWFTGNSKSLYYYGSGVSYVHTGFDKCSTLGCNSLSGVYYNSGVYYGYLLKTYPEDDSYNYTEATDSGYLRPFVQIYSNVKIASGSGTGADPYVLAAPSS